MLLRHFLTFFATNMRRNKINSVKMTLNFKRQYKAINPSVYWHYMSRKKTRIYITVFLITMFCMAHIFFNKTTTYRLYHVRFPFPGHPPRMQRLLQRNILLSSNPWYISLKTYFGLQNSPIHLQNYAEKITQYLIKFSYFECAWPAA